MTEELREVELSDWMLGEWPDSRDAVCVLEGFSGIGKSSVAHRVRRAWDGPAVAVSVNEADDMESLLFLIASKLESDGCSIVAGDADGDFRRGLIDLLSTRSLVVLDDFESALDPETRLPMHRGITEFIREVADRRGTGRLLLVTSESPAEGPWLHNAVVKTMFPPSGDDALGILETLLRARGLLDEVTSEQRRDVVAWLGGNPRAMEALVACLRDDPLDELINLDVDAWESRDLAASPTVVARLEQRFLSKTIERLDPTARVLLQSLSVFRRSFTIDALREATPRGSSAELLKEALTSRFLISRDRRWYTVNPIARQLCLSTLDRNIRRRSISHRVAADHYRKRMQPRPTGGIGGGGTPRDLVRMGAEFVEARYHYLQIGADAEFQELAGRYRRVILKNYQHLSQVPVETDSQNELIATLGAVLFDLPEGHGSLRAVLASLLARRGRTNDLNLAYRQVVLSTRDAVPASAWMLRLDLAQKLDSLAAVEAVATQALNRLAENESTRVVRRAIEHLVSHGSVPEAEKLVEEAFSVLREPDARQPICSLRAYMLTRAGDRKRAIDFLADSYAEIGRSARHGWRLFEQALFLSHQERDRSRIARLRELIASAGINEHQPILCDVLTLQLDGDYAEAAELALQHTDYFAVAAQGAFCALANGDVEQAGHLLERGRFVPNSATWWLRGVVALCQGQGAIYLESMSRSLGRDLAQGEAEDVALWIKTWAAAPPWLGIYPSFYFPRIPAVLTGLDEEMVPSGQHVPIENLYRLRDVTLPRPKSVAQARGADSVGHEEARGRPESTRTTIVNIIEENVVGDSYRADNGVVIGGNARVWGPVAGRDVVWPGGVDSKELVDDLRRLVDAFEAGEGGDWEGGAEALRDALAAAEQGDARSMSTFLQRAGRWAFDLATAAGAGVAATAIAAASGLS